MTNTGIGINDDTASIWLEGLVAGADGGVVLVGRDGNILLSNPAAASLMGGVVPEGTVTEWMAKLHFGSNAEAEADTADLPQQIISGEILRDIDVFVTPSEGQKGNHLRLSAFPVTGMGDAEGQAIVFRDVGEQLFIQQVIQQELSSTNRRLSESIAKLEDSNSVMGLITEMGDFLLSCVSRPEFYEVTANYVCRIFPRASGAVYLLDEDQDRIESVAAWGEEDALESNFTVEDCWALRRGRAHRVDGQSFSPRCRHLNLSTHSYICLPMMALGKALGVLYVGTGAAEGSMDGGGAADGQLRKMISVTEHIAGALANLRLRETLRVQAIRDPLTGLFNRRHMREWADQELKRVQDDGGVLSVVMMDLDHFKQINDTYGHSAADEVLKAVADILISDVGTNGIACRYGGEEFALLLPNCSGEVAMERASRILARMRATTVHYEGETLGEISGSFGVASYPRDGTDYDRLVRAADAAMYDAKSAGRSQAKRAEVRLLAS